MPWTNQHKELIYESMLCQRVQVHLTVQCSACCSPCAAVLSAQGWRPLFFPELPIDLAAVGQCQPDPPVLQHNFGDLVCSTVTNIGTAHTDALPYSQDTGSHVLAENEIIGIRANENPASQYTLEVTQRNSDVYSNGQRLHYDSLPLHVFHRQTLQDTGQ